MCLREQSGSLWPQRLHILGSDLNPEFLQTAVQGSYGSPSFRQLDSRWQKRYFKPDGKRWIIDSSLRERVRFTEHNLVSCQLPAGLVAGQVDLIFCRNVFIYFSAQTTARVLTLFRHALKPNGVLILGHAETLQPLKRWRTEYHPGAFYYLPPLMTQLETRVSPGPSVAGKQTGLRPAPTLDPTPENVPPSAPAIKVPDGMPVEILLATARHSANVGNLDDAHRLLTELTERDKTCTEGHLLTAVVAEQLGDWEGARRALKKSLFLDKHLVLGHYLLAVLDERQGKLAEACKRYRTVSRLLAGAGNEDLAYSDGIPASRFRELSEARATELSDAA
jgi:chemotaxis protein methyltransferase CheR